MKQRQHNGTRRRPQDERQRYRLSKERWHYQIIRLDHDDARTLRALAEREGTSVAQLLREFTTWGLENYGAT
jgi:Ribbon-helix-helix protein, copG family